MSRPTWHDTWMQVADVIAERGLCTGRKIGAVITTNVNRVIATGYPGPPAGMRLTGPCTEWCPRRLDPPQSLDDYSSCFNIHAEINALLFADRSTYTGGTMYITAPPCLICARAIANSGLSQVVYRLADRDEHLDHGPALHVMLESGLLLEQVKGTGNPCRTF